MEYQQSILEPLLSALLELSTLYCTHFPCEYYFNVFPRSSMKGEMQRVGLPRYPALCVVFTAPGQAIISSYPDHGNIQTNLSTSTLASEQYILHTALHFKMQIWFCSQPSYNPSVIPHCPQDRAQIPNMVSKPTNHPGFFQFFMPHPLPPLPRHPFIYLIPSCPSALCLAIVSWRNPSLKPWYSLQWRFFFIALSKRVTHSSVSFFD